jgi:hypothetical protein
VIATAELHVKLWDDLQKLLSRNDRIVHRVSETVSGPSLADNLLRRLGMPAADSPTPANIGGTSEEVRALLITALRQEQQAAQQEITTAKAAGAAIDTFVRDVGGWLAAGLRDLLDDRITGAAFLAPNKGAIAKLASGDIAARFSESDFMRPDGIKFLEASRAAQSILTKLSLASTNQFRAAAERLLNSIVDRLTVPSAAAKPANVRLNDSLAASGNCLVLLVDNTQLAEACTWLKEPMVAIQWIVAGETEDAFAPLISNGFTLVSYVKEATPTIEEPPAALGPAQALTGSASVATEPVAERENTDLFEALRTERARADAFVKRGLLRGEDFDAAEYECLEQALQSTSAELLPPMEASAEEFCRELRERLISAWLDWFERQLRDFDCENFLQHGDNATLFAPIEAAIAGWEGNSAAPSLPLTEADFAAAESLIAELRRLDRQRRIPLSERGDEWRTFEAAVATGGAPLDLYTQGVEYFLFDEKEEWKNYRIVRIPPDERPASDADQYRSSDLGD